ncbi:MAG: type VI secretion system tube protein Hcp [Bacteroidales bacterium]|nr:type VI secretion system tube protein Hcp [Bacteroidales bacterium]
MKKITVFLFANLLCLGIIAQNVAISDDSLYSGDNSAILDLKSDTKGLLVPRMTSVQRENIALPAKGLLIYQTSEAEGFYVNRGTPAQPNWEYITGSSEQFWASDSLGTSIVLSDPDDKVGIGTENPMSKLSANGMIESMTEGFRFPDGTIQTTAFKEEGAGSGAAEGRWVAAIYCPECPGNWGYQGYEECSIVFDLDWGVHVPRDATTGMPSGNRQHQPLTVTKNIDKSSVCFITKICEHQHIPEIILYLFWFNPNNGAIELYYEIRMWNCIVVDFSHGVVYTGNDKYAHTDVISFIYEKMRWSWIPDGIEYEDNWIFMPTGN